MNQIEALTANQELFQAQPVKALSFGCVKVLIDIRDETRYLTLGRIQMQFYPRLLELADVLPNST